MVGLSPFMVTSLLDYHWLSLGGGPCDDAAGGASVFWSHPKNSMGPKVYPATVGWLAQSGAGQFSTGAAAGSGAGIWFWRFFLEQVPSDASDATAAACAGPSRGSAVSLNL